VVSTAKRNIKLRIRDTQTQDVYELWFEFRISQVYVKQIKCKPELKGKLLYSWHPATSMYYLTCDKIEHAIKRVDDINVRQ